MRSYTKVSTNYYSKWMQKLHGNGKFSKYVLSRIAKKMLKPIYNLARKGRPFAWGKEQQDASKEIKCRLIKPPVLLMPNIPGRFHLYSHTSKIAAGSVLYQIQNGKPKLIAYVSKRLPESANNILLQN